MNNNKKLIISLICSLALLIGGTYAAWTFLTEKTNITMMVDGDQISFTAGENITLSGILPVYSMEEGVTKDIQIYKENGEYTAGIDLYLNLTTWSPAFASSSFRWALYKNGNYLSSGDFSNTTQGNEVKLTSYTQKINLQENTDNYKLYLWIDAYQENSVDMMNNSFTVSLYGKASFYDGTETIAKEVEPNAPQLAKGMIPVRYNYAIDEWEKADSTNADNNWYNYNDKMWANAVLVTSDSRERYMDEAAGITINENDILAYYVWIPRYKYLLFNVNSEISSHREIQIVFEKTTDTISQNAENGKYLSHPAFWWDNDSNGIRASDGSEELAGIWVGKFETSNTVENPKIIPNVNSTATLTTYKLFTMNKNIESTTYLTEIGVNTIDAHMIKNTEWGAVAYLSHSRYGKNSEVKPNNNTRYITGRQGNYTYNDFIISNNSITKNKAPGTGTLTSTTGNIYGIYDMSGGRAEYVMGMLKTSETDDSPSLKNTGFSSPPPSKYYNLYEYVVSNTDFSKRILGDATGETAGWYSDWKTFISGGYPWFIRGYSASNTGNPGIFAFDNHHGGANDNGSRGVIVLP